MQDSTASPTTPSGVNAGDSSVAACSTGGDSGLGQSFFSSSFQPPTPTFEPTTAVQTAEPTPTVQLQHDTPSIVLKPVPKCKRNSQGFALKWKVLVLLWIIVLSVFSIYWMGQSLEKKIRDIQEKVRFFFEQQQIGVYVGLAVLFVLSVIITWNINKGVESSDDKDLMSPSSPFHKSAELGNADVYSSTKHEVPCRRTFTGQGPDVWNEFRRYFENIALLNRWDKEYTRRMLLCSLRGQAESYAYGLPEKVQGTLDSLLSNLEQRFGILNMKESYLADAKSRKKLKTETFREFGQALEELYRKAYPNNAEMVNEHALSTFLNNCHELPEFRLAVKRTRPRTIQEAVTSAIQEECLRETEKERSYPRWKQNQVYDVQQRRGRGRGGRNKYRGMGNRGVKQEMQKEEESLN